MANQPTASEAEAAMARAVAYRRAIHEADPTYAGHTNLVERVLGVPGHPQAGDGEWWDVGSVFDEITGDELVVWYRPRRLRLEPRYPEAADAAPPKPPRHYQRGGDNMWMDRETDQPLRGPDGLTVHGHERPKWLPEDT